MQVTSDLIQSVVREVLAHMRNGHAPGGNGKSRHCGVFDDVDSAVSAAGDAQREFETRGLDDRRKAVNCLRRICIDQAEPLGRMEFEETKIGRLSHKIEKLVVAGEKTPGVEFLRTEAFSGGYGIALQEFAPF